MPALCRDCDHVAEETFARCPACGSRRVIAHPELLALAVAHVDCDAFYASVEKRDRPELLARPVIVGGGTRGVVSAACYIARTRGVRSAMPMFKALAACPDAVVIRPDMQKYVAAAREVRALMESLTPMVQPLSIDEAVLDLAGTQALHKAPPAVVLARFARAVEREIRITVSIGLAPNRLLAKLAAERDKPRGFAVMGAEAAAWLAEQPVTLLPGVGPALARKLNAAGFTRLGQLAALDPREAARRFGEDGPALAARALAAGAFVAIPHPAWYGLTAEDAAAIPGAHAVEIYNHTSQLRTERGDSVQYADALLAGGRRIGLIAVDDAHFACMDAFGGWLMVKAEVNDPDALLAALKAGAYYATQGPTIHDIAWGEDSVEITCSPAASVMLLGRGSRAVQHVEPGTTRARLPFGAHRVGGFARVVVADAQGRRAWGNPVFFDR
jgi:hypothetical protein